MFKYVRIYKIGLHWSLTESDVDMYETAICKLGIKVIHSEARTSLCCALWVILGGQRICDGRLMGLRWCQETVSKVKMQPRASLKKQNGGILLHFPFILFRWQVYLWLPLTPRDLCWCSLVGHWLLKCTQSVNYQSSSCQLDN